MTQTDQTNQAVSAYIQNINQPWQVEIATRLRQTILEAVPSVDERLQYSKPHYKKGGQYLAVFGTAKGWVSLTIFNAQDLDTPDGLFEASDNRDRQTIKIRQGQEVDYAMLADLIRQAASTIPG